MNAVTHPRLPPRRSSGGATWWSKAVLRAVEETAFSESDLRRGRALARGGAVGAITVDTGSAVAAVQTGDDAWTVTVTVPPLDDTSADTFLELVAAGSGHIGALLSGELPHPFVEAVEEAGVELLPYGGELGAGCSCDAWLDPCPHALAVLTQLAWLIQVDPFVLTHLRGLSRDEVLQRLHHRSASVSSAPGLDTSDPDVDAPALAVAEDAAGRAAHALDQLSRGLIDRVGP